MTGNPHMASPLATFGAPLASARVVVMLIHGRAQSPADMDQHLVRRIALPDVAYVAPEAADRTWYPGRFMAPVEENQPQLDFALERLGALSDQLAALGRPHAAQVLMGFSQGACLACEHVWRRRQRLAALVAFTGGLIGPPGLRWEAQDGATAAPLDGMPVLLGGGDADSWVPVSRMQETADLLRQLGARVTLQLFPGAEHLVRDEQIASARELLAALPAG